MLSTSPFTPLNAGPVSLEFDPRLGCLRYFRAGGTEFLRGIYAVVRDQFWGTAPTQISVTHQDIREDSFNLEVNAICQAGEVDFSWTGRLWGTAQGEVGFDFTGVSASQFLRNRIGLCLLHPIPASSDNAFSVQTPDGTWNPGAFPPPHAISPWQPATDICGLRFSTPREGGAVEIEFQHEHFEMEDQRNWGDHSFKTYCTPQHRPRPVQVHDGDVIRQTTIVRLLHPPAAVAEAQTIFTRQADKPRPKLGLVAATDEHLISAPVLNSLRAMNLDHLRLHLRLRQTDWRVKLERTQAAAKALGCDYHLAAFFTDDAEPELLALKEACAGQPPALWLIFHERKGRTPQPLIELAQEILGEPHPLAAGSDSSFCEINRDRPPAEATWLPAWPSQPQSHLTDNETLAENFPAQLDALRSLAEFCPRPGVIGPITVRKRFANDAWFKGIIKEWTDLPPDPRQEGDSGAAWMLGSLAWLCRADNAYSLTYFATHGPSGVLHADGSRKPAGEMLCLIGSSASLASMASPDPLALSALGLADGSALVVNHSAVEQTVAGQIIRPWSVGRIFNF